MTDAAIRTGAAVDPQRQTVAPLASAATSTFDRAYVLEIIGEDAAEVCEFLTLVIRDVPESVRMVAERVREGDVNAVARLGHKISGTAGNVASVRVGPIAAAIEEVARSADTSSLPALSLTLSAAAADLVQELEAWSRELTAVGS
jgi:HPt (histidine-containing phosphotransfer) domain-containing protein